jgi:hypothetical protein
MTAISNLIWTILSVCVSILAITPEALAQRNPAHIALKGGESVDLRNFFFIVGCRSVLIGTPEVEVLEGPDEVILTFREEPVLPRVQNCPKPVPGGIIVATAKAVTEQKEAKLTFRLKFNSKLGTRQTSGSYVVSLYPGAPSAGGLGVSTPSTNSTGPGAPSSPQ